MDKAKSYSIFTYRCSLQTQTEPRSSRTSCPPRSRPSACVSTLLSGTRLLTWRWKYMDAHPYNHLNTIYSSSGVDRLAWLWWWKSTDVHLYSHLNTIYSPSRVDRLAWLWWLKSTDVHLYSHWKKIYVEIYCTDTDKRKSALYKCP